MTKPQPDTSPDAIFQVHLQSELAGDLTNGGENRFAEEPVISFTHLIKMDHVLPRVEPTGARVEAVFVVIVGIDAGTVAYAHILSEQVSLLGQLGLLDSTGLPVVGAAAAARLRNPALPDPFFQEGEILGAGKGGFSSG